MYVKINNYLIRQRILNSDAVVRKTITTLRTIIKEKTKCASIFYVYKCRTVKDKFMNILNYKPV